MLQLGAEGTRKMILSKHSSQSGATLIEATIAACTSAMFLGSLFTMNVSAMSAMRTAREATSASQILQERVEAMRIANWHQVTDADWLRANLLGTDADGANGLRQLSETLILVPYDSVNTGNTQITRASGSTSIVNRNSALLTESAVKVIWTVAYSGGMNSKSTTRQAVAILSKGGVAKW